MNKIPLSVEIVEVENGYIVTETPYYSVPRAPGKMVCHREYRKTWVARSEAELAESIRELAIAAQRGES